MAENPTTRGPAKVHELNKDYRKYRSLHSCVVITKGCHSTQIMQVVKHDIYHVILVILSYGVQQHPMIYILFIPLRISEYPLTWNLPCDTVYDPMIITM